MSYLCQQYKVHNVPVGDEQTKAMIGTVLMAPHTLILHSFWGLSAKVLSFPAHQSLECSVKATVLVCSNLEDVLKGF